MDLFTTLFILETMGLSVFTTDGNTLNVRADNIKSLLSDNCQSESTDGNILNMGADNIKIKGLSQCDMLHFPTYVGETSRPWRDRIREHLENAKNLKPDSVIIQHWADCHSTQTYCPEFEFSIVKHYKDPLRRQICEAIYIQEQGTLNRKTEFNVNELCRLETNKHWKDLETEVFKESESKATFISKMHNFVDVMKNVVDNAKKITDPLTCYRSKRPLKCLGGVEKKSKTRKMECSTPTFAPNYRSQMVVLEDTSPILNIGREIDTSCDSGKSSDAVIINKSPTNVSNEFAASKLTPVKQESSSVENLKLTTTATNWDRAAVRCGLIRRARSLPDISLKSNAFYGLSEKGGMDVAVGRLRRLSLRDEGNHTAESIEDFIRRWSSNSDFGGVLANSDALQETGQAQPNEELSEKFINPDHQGQILVNLDAEEIPLNSEAEEIPVNSDIPDSKASFDELNCVSLVDRKFSAITLGIGAERNVLDDQATAQGPQEKRCLNLSPDTVIGSPRKFRIQEKDMTGGDGVSDGEMLVVIQKNQHLAGQKVILPRLSSNTRRRASTMPSLGKSPSLIKRAYRKRIKKGLIVDRSQPLINDVLGNQKNSNKSPRRGAGEDDSM